MLFNSYQFIFVFLPLTLLGFHLIAGMGQHSVAIAWLVIASLFFYGWWSPAHLVLLLGSMLFNYVVGVSLGGKPRRPVLIVGITANLTLLGYFKYANFFVDNVNTLIGAGFTLETIVLPLAISFFTFQQIAYLVDVYRGQIHEQGFLHYALFVTFFPQLIAGPIVHHNEMLPQFTRLASHRLRSKYLAPGFTIFAIGLFKKVVLADGIVTRSDPVFLAAEQGISLTFFEAWGGSLAWTFRYYFDFSGYSDMASGLALMFGIRLARNFNSPYKATSMIDYWRRWHITLSRFLLNYLYIPLGGNRKGPSRQRINLLVTMLLGGIWHGASWTFVIWGGLNALFLIINALYQQYRRAKGKRGFFQNWFTAWLLTFTCAVIARVLFCSTTIAGAGNVLAAMAGLHGFGLTEMMLKDMGGGELSFSNLRLVFAGMFRNGVFYNPKAGVVWLAILLLISVALPNTQQIMRRCRPAIETYRGEVPRVQWKWLEWRPTPPWAFFAGALFAFAVLGLTHFSKFLYFQF